MAPEKCGCLTVRGKNFYVYEGVNTIGRDKNATVIIKDLGVSQQHALLIVVDESRHFITDFNSSNGTHLNNNKLTPHKLYGIDDRSVICFSVDVDASYRKIPKNKPNGADVTLNETQSTQTTDETIYAAQTQLFNDTNFLTTTTQTQLPGKTPKTQNDAFPNDGFDFGSLDTQRAIEGERTGNGDIYSLETQVLNVHELPTQNDGLNFTVKNDKSSVLNVKSPSAGRDLPAQGCSSLSVSSRDVHDASTLISSSNSSAADLHDLPTQLIADVHDLPTQVVVGVEDDSATAETQIVDLHEMETQLVTYDYPPETKQRPTNGVEEAEITSTLDRAAFEVLTDLYEKNNAQESSASCETTESPPGIPKNSEGGGLKATGESTSGGNEPNRIGDVVVGTTGGSSKSNSDQKSNFNQNTSGECSKSGINEKKMIEIVANSKTIDSDATEPYDSADSEDFMANCSITQMLSDNRDTNNEDSDRESQLQVQRLKRRVLHRIDSEEEEEEIFDSDPQSQLPVHLLKKRASGRRLNSDDFAAGANRPGEGSDTEVEDVGDGKKLMNAEPPGNNASSVGGGNEENARVESDSDTDVEIAGVEERVVAASSNVAQIISSCHDGNSTIGKDAKNPSELTTERVQDLNGTAEDCSNATELIEDSDTETEDGGGGNHKNPNADQSSILSTTDIEDSFVKRKSFILGDVSSEFIPATQEYGDESRLSFAERRNLSTIADATETSCSDSFRLGISFSDDAKEDEGGIYVVKALEDDDENSGDSEDFAVKPKRNVADASNDDFDFDAPTQKLGNANESRVDGDGFKVPLVKSVSKNSSRAGASASGLDDSELFGASTQVVDTSRNLSDDDDLFIAATQKMPADKSLNDSDIFNAMTQKANNDEENPPPKRNTHDVLVAESEPLDDSDIFGAATQRVVTEPRRRGTDTSMDDSALFSLATQKINPDQKTDSELLFEADTQRTAAAAPVPSDGSAAAPALSDDSLFLACTQKVVRNLNTQDTVTVADSESFDFEKECLNRSDIKKRVSFGKVEDAEEVIDNKQKPVEIMKSPQAAVKENSNNKSNNSGIESQLEVMFDTENVRLVLHDNDEQRPDNPLGKTFADINTQDVLNALDTQAENDLDNIPKEIDVSKQGEVIDIPNSSECQKQAGSDETEVKKNDGMMNVENTSKEQKICDISVGKREEAETTINPEIIRSGTPLRRSSRRNSKTACGSDTPRKPSRGNAEEIDRVIEKEAERGPGRTIGEVNQNAHKEGQKRGRKGSVDDRKEMDKESASKCRRRNTRSENTDNDGEEAGEEGVASGRTRRDRKASVERDKVVEVAKTEEACRGKKQTGGLGVIPEDSDAEAKTVKGVKSNTETKTMKSLPIAKPLLDSRRTGKLSTIKIDPADEEREDDSNFEDFEIEEDAQVSASTSSGKNDENAMSSSKDVHKSLSSASSSSLGSSSSSCTESAMNFKVVEKKIISNKENINSPIEQSVVVEDVSNAERRRTTRARKTKFESLEEENLSVSKRGRPKKDKTAGEGRAGVVKGRKRKSSTSDDECAVIRVSVPRNQKRMVMCDESLNKAALLNSTEVLLNASVVPAAKRARKKVTTKVIFTMLDSPQLQKLVRTLGGSVADSIENATVLVTKSILRTQKLLSAVGQGIPICSPDWLHESNKANAFQDPWNYLLEDKEAEKKWNFSLKDSLSRSKSRKLFEGLNFLLLSTYVPETLKGAIESCGGKCYAKTPKQGDFIVVAAPENRTKCTKYLGGNVKVVLPEAILDAVLRQEMHFDEHLLT